MFKKVRRLSKEWATIAFNTCFNHPYGYVYMLHRIGANEPYRLGPIRSLNVSEIFLQRFIDERREMYDFVSVEEVVLRVKDSEYRKGKRPFVCFTFDDGYRDNYTVGLPFFRHNNIPFAVYLTANFISNPKPFNYPFIMERIICNNDHLLLSDGTDVQCKSNQDKEKAFMLLKEKVLKLSYVGFEDTFRKLFGRYLDESYLEDNMLTWEQVQEMKASGLCSIGAHTMTHCRLANVSPQQRLYELGECRKVITSYIGEDVRSITYPYGWVSDVDDSTMNEASLLGYTEGFVSYGGPIRKYDCNLMALKRQMLIES